MPFRLGDIVPDFACDTSLHRIDSFHQWLGSSWGILFSHPADFTPVCTTELGAVARLGPDWSKRNVKVIALSVDSVQSHLAWIGDINETQRCNVDFPIIADSDRKIATHYDMLDHLDPRQVDKNGMPLTVRAVFIIDPSKRLRTQIVYPATTGRNFAEILRVVDSLQLADKQKIATPQGWTPGDEVVISMSVSDDQAKQLFPQGWRTEKPYLRLTKLL